MHSYEDSCEMDHLATQHRIWARFAQNRAVLHHAGVKPGPATLCFEIVFKTVSGVKVPAFAAGAVARGATIRHALKVSLLHTPTRKFLGTSILTKSVRDPRDQPGSTTAVTIDYHDECVLWVTTDTPVNNLAAIVELVVQGMTYIDFN